MKTLFITFLLIIFNIVDAYSQDTIRISTELIKETAIYGGYSFNTGDTANKKSHIIEIGIWKSKYVTHIEPANFNYYIGTEFLIHDSQLAIGPKIGSYVGLWMFCLGTDLIYYTDFSESALRLVPYVGFGGHSFKLTFNFYANLTNKEFIYTNPLSINLAIQLKSLKRK